LLGYFNSFKEKATVNFICKTKIKEDLFTILFFNFNIKHSLILFLFLFDLFVFWNLIQI